MTDTTTQQRLTVETAGDAPPYIPLPEQQCAQVQAVLDAHGISYEVESLAISVDGGPATTVINLARKTDPVRVQRILDAIP